MSNIAKDCGEIWNRLFDHRPFLNGEIKYFIEEFEEKRNDREVSRLFDVLEKVTEIRDTQLDKIKTLSSSKLPTLQTRLNLALEKCQLSLDYEDNNRIVKKFLYFL
uniref:Biogenesis of lysosome-related organelles complex 1 subunit 5 n=1 Tax=Clastoptera arizonana TaxID=38151 RepID=A0A1B6DE80_9HEMI